MARQSEQEKQEKGDTRRPRRPPGDVLGDVEYELSALDGGPNRVRQRLLQHLQQATEQTIPHSKARQLAHQYSALGNALRTQMHHARKHLRSLIAILGRSPRLFADQKWLIDDLKTQDFALAGVVKRRDACIALSKQYREATHMRRKLQWGPAIGTAVNDVLTQAAHALSKRGIHKQGIIDQYVGLLCVAVGVLPHPKTFAGLRLGRAVRLRLARVREFAPTPKAVTTTLLDLGMSELRELADREPSCYARTPRAPRDHVLLTWQRRIEEAKQSR